MLDKNKILFIKNTKLFLVEEKTSRYRTRCSKKKIYLLLQINNKKPEEEMDRIIIYYRHHIRIFKQAIE